MHTTPAPQGSNKNSSLDALAQLSGALRPPLPLRGKVPTAVRSILQVRRLTFRTSLRGVGSSSGIDSGKRSSTHRALNFIQFVLHGGLNRWLVAALWAAAAVVGWAPTAVYAASICPCLVTAGGNCQRWHQPEVPWTSYFGPAADLSATTQPAAKAVTNDQWEAAMIAAVAAWTQVKCDLCMEPDPSGKGCRSAACLPHPGPLQAPYLGKADKPTVASSCGGVYCADAAPGTAQLAVVRRAQDWPLSTTVLTAPVLTVTKKGVIVDADVLFYDNGKTFCEGTCASNQYPILGVMVQEVGHFLGVGFTPQTMQVLAANYNRKAALTATLSAEDTMCLCDIYATSDNTDDCTPEPVLASSSSCSAAPVSGQGGDAVGWLAVLVGGFALAALRRKLSQPDPA